MSKYLTFVFGLIFSNFIYAQLPNDCANAIVVCGSGAFSSDATGFGVQEISNSCGGKENNSFWLKVNIVQAGTLGFDLIPNETGLTVDYDFYVYGPNLTCATKGSPIRCATQNPGPPPGGVAAANNHTGMNGTSLFTVIGPGPTNPGNKDGYVRWLDVLPGESYYIAIDRPVGSGGFTINWTGSAMAGNGAFPSSPIVQPVNDYVLCSSNPNVSLFNLNNIRTQIYTNSGLNPLTNQITFYETYAKAIDGLPINQLPNLYSNKSNPQTIYAKVVESVQGCFTIVDFDLKVFGSPTADLSLSKAEACVGDNVTITFTGTPGATVDYTVNGGAVQSVVLDPTGKFDLPETAAVNTTYTLVMAKVVDGTGAVICSTAENDTVSYTVVSTPVMSGTFEVCIGNTTQLSATGTPAATSPWTSSNPLVASVNSTGLVTGNTAGTVTITFTNSAGCSDSETVTVAGTPTATISGSTDVCEGSASPVVTFTGSGSTSPYTFVYTLNGGANQTITTTTGNTATISVPTNAVGSFVYELISVSATTTPICSQAQSGTVTVNVLASPTAAISYAGPYCISFAGQANVTQTGNAGGVYAATPAGLTINSSTGVITPSTSTPGNYTVSYTVAASGSCPQLIVTTTVGILDIPKPNTDSEYVCVDQTTNMPLPGSTAILDSGLNSVDYTFEWFDSAGNLVGTDSTYETDVVGVYTLTVTTVGSQPCSATVNKEVEAAYPAISASYTVSDYFQDSKIIVTVVGDGDYLFELDNSGNFQPSNIFYSVTPGLHTVTVNDEKGCTDIVLDGILVIDYPRFLTPNGDGENDTWNITSLSDQPNAEINIFDRFGRLIMRTTPGGQSWDGTYNGTPLPSTDFWFTVRFVENGVEKLFKSHFSLKR